MDSHPKRTVLITGASSGIGKAFAKHFAQEGWDVVITARRQAPMDTLSKDLEKSYGTEVTVIVTDLADPELFGLHDDTSNIATSRYYKTATNLPWALEVGTEWLHPLERVDILDAYPLFQDWVESGGVNNTDWYLPVNSVLEKVYQ